MINARSSDLVIALTDPRGPAALHLVAQLSADIVVLYGDLGDDGSGNFRPEDAAGPGSGFLIATLDGRPVGCGAFRPWEPGIAEVKRMYVEPDVRGQGIARRLLAELERLAQEAGYSAIRLETGDRQPAAIRVYETSGYIRIPNYGNYSHHPNSLCYEKSLLESAQRLGGPF